MAPEPDPARHRGSITKPDSSHGCARSSSACGPPRRLFVAPALAQEPPDKIAVAILEKVIARQFSEIVAQFNPEMAAAVPGSRGGLGSADGDRGSPTWPGGATYDPVWRSPAMPMPRSASCHGSTPLVRAGAGKSRPEEYDRPDVVDGEVMGSPANDLGHVVCAE